MDCLNESFEKFFEKKKEFRESDPLEVCLGCSYIESGTRSHTEKEVLPTEGS